MVLLLGTTVLLIAKTLRPPDFVGVADGFGIIVSNSLNIIINNDYPSTIASYVSGVY